MFTPDGMTHVIGVKAAGQGECWHAAVATAVTTVATRCWQQHAVAQPAVARAGCTSCRCRAADLYATHRADTLLRGYTDISKP